MYVVNSVRARVVAVLAALAMALTLGMVAVQTATAPDAAAHGSVTDPPSRNYGCHQRTGANHDDPAMAQYDPMCWQAWQTNPDTMWNWNGLLVDGLGGNYSSVGNQVCSGGGTQNGRYSSLDNPGNWVAKGVGTNVHVRIDDQASHGADFLRIYVTRQGFDPTTQQVGWNDLDLVKETGYYPATGLYETDVNLSGHSGRAVLVTLWKASHQDQTYFICSDINIGGSDLGPWYDDVDPSDPGDPEESDDPTTPPPAGDGQCTAAVTVSNSWDGGYQGTVTVTAGSAAIDGWSVGLSGATVTQAWNANLSGSSTLDDAGYNGSLAAGASTTAGFIGSGSPPTSATCTAG